MYRVIGRYKVYIRLRDLGVEGFRSVELSDLGFILGVKKAASLGLRVSGLVSFRRPTKTTYPSWVLRCVHSPKNPCEL